MTLFLHNIRRPYSTLQFTSYGHDAEKGISTNPQTKKIVLWMRVVLIRSLSSDYLVFGVIKYFSKGLLIILRVWRWFFSLWSFLKSGMANVPLKKSSESMMILNAGLSPYILRNSCCNDACSSTLGKLLTSLSQKHSYNIETPIFASVGTYLLVEEYFQLRIMVQTQLQSNICKYHFFPGTHSSKHTVNILNQVFLKSCFPTPNLTRKAGTWPIQNAEYLRFLQDLNKLKQFHSSTERKPLKIEEEIICNLIKHGKLLETGDDMDKLKFVLNLLRKWD